MDDAINSDDDHELEEETRESRVPFGRSSLDRYRASPPPSFTDDHRAVIQQYAERNTLRLCRRGKKIIGTDGSSYRAACGNGWSCPLCSPQLLAKSQHYIEWLLQSVPGQGRARVAFYLCEQNAIRESRNGKGRTPGDLLHNVAATGDADDLGLLLGFHEAVAGKRKLSTSRGFWDL